MLRTVPAVSRRRVLAGGAALAALGLLPTGCGAPPPPSLPDVVNALRDSAESARQVALTLSDYRAGLLASISASCTAAVTVALAPGEPAH